MRLPWPFGRAQRSPSPDGAGAGSGTSGPSLGGASGTTSDGASASPPDRAPAGAWRSLPPLAETVGPPPLVAPNRPFAANLAASEPPAPILAPLSHGRSLEAPKGLVSGIARPTTTVAAPSLPAPVQRSPLGGRRAHAHDGGGWAEASASDATQASVTSPATAPTEPSTTTRRLEPVTARPASVATLTQAPAPARPALVGLVGQPVAAGSARTAMPTAAIQRSPAAAAPASPPAPAPSAPPPAAPLAPSTPIAAAPRLTIGQARRLGLGVPFAGGSVGEASAVLRGTASNAASSPQVTERSSAAAAPGVQRSPDSAASDAHGAPQLELPLAARPAPPGIRDESRPAPVVHGAAMQPAVAEALQAPVAARRIGPAPERSTAARQAPLVSSRPLRAGVQRAPTTLPQRAPGDGSAEAMHGAAPTPTAAAAGGPVRIHRDSQATQLSSALDARSFTHGGEIFLPASHGPLSSGTGKALLAHELTHVSQQRRLGSSLPAEHTAHGKSLEAEAVAAERSPDMTLAMPPPAKAAPQPGHGAPGSDAGGAPAGTQRAPSGTDAVKPQRTPPPTGQGGSGTGGAPGSKHTHTEQELEVLAHQLYHRIGRHLRRELLVDRERVGFALDLP